MGQPCSSMVRATGRGHTAQSTAAAAHHTKAINGLGGEDRAKQQVLYVCARALSGGALARAPAAQPAASMCRSSLRPCSVPKRDLLLVHCPFARPCAGRAGRTGHQCGRRRRQHAQPRTQQPWPQAPRAPHAWALRRARGPAVAGARGLQRCGASHAARRAAALARSAAVTALKRCRLAARWLARCAGRTAARDRAAQGPTRHPCCV